VVPKKTWETKISAYQFLPLSEGINKILYLTVHKTKTAKEGEVWK